jgi:acrylyl-CoA reductase (NADPH)
MFKALYITRTDKTTPQQCTLTDLDEAQLPEGDVLVQVAYSTLNYKDSLAVTGKSPIVRRYPIVPGIDLAGTVLESSDARYKKGDEIVINGWGLGELYWGGFAQKARVKADWLIPLAKGLTLQQSMAIGTAGYTAALCVMALQEHHVAPQQGPVLVTGGNGGVGSIAISLLAHLGYTVHTSTGRTQEAEHLKALGASAIIDRAELNAPGKPLQKERWAGAVDSIGSHTLANVCASTMANGTVAACGLAQGMDFPSTVAPFILRGVTLAGVCSVEVPYARRVQAWKLLAETLPPEIFTGNTATIGLTQVQDTAPQQLAGKVRGRIVVDVNK